MKQLFHRPTLQRVLAVVITAVTLSLILTSCGNRLSGTFVPEDPDDPAVLFTEMRFEGKTVHIEAAGSSIGLDYQIKDGSFSFKDNINFKIGDETVPKSFTFTKLDDGSFLLGDVHYVPAD